MLVFLFLSQQDGGCPYKQRFAEMIILVNPVFIWFQEAMVDVFCALFL